MNNMKFANAKTSKSYFYKTTKEKLCKINASVLTKYIELNNSLLHTYK